MTIETRKQWKFIKQISTTMNDGAKERGKERE